ncbi:MAG: ATP-binding protein [Nitriliruptoraceae bacterium]
MQVQAEWPQARIFILDDEPAIRDTLTRMLMATGYEAVEVFAAADALLDAYGVQAPDLLLLDLQMPEVDGIEVLREIGSLPHDARSPSIVMTSARRAEDVHRTLELGAADFLHKPVEAIELLLRVRHQLRERRLRKDLADHNRRLEELAVQRAGELALLSQVLDDIPVAAAVLEDDLRLRYANRRARELFVGNQFDLAGSLQPLATSSEHVATNAGTTDSNLALPPGERIGAFLAGAISVSPRTMVCRLTRQGLPDRRVELEAQRVHEDFIAVLIHDVELQQRAQEALRRALEVEQHANDELRSVESLRTSFLTAVSHELRTPLTVVLGLAESLETHANKLDGGQRASLVTRLHQNARRLARLLDDLLDLNRMVVGRLEVASTRCDLRDLVDGALRDMDIERHELTFDVPSVEVDVAAGQIRRVVSNLVRNATVHTPAGTPIRVTASVHGTMAQLRVIDEGPGIDDSLKARIFEPFEQGPSAPSHQPGTGIGLSLVREFVQLHGGRSWVEDTPGGGATFVVELPRFDRDPDTQANG